jgi:translation initiation factor 2 gamma subunit (eIF-2gamma)
MPQNNTVTVKQMAQEIHSPTAVARTKTTITQAITQDKTAYSSDTISCSKYDKLCYLQLTLIKLQFCNTNNYQHLHFIKHVNIKTNQNNIKMSA